MANRHILFENWLTDGLDGFAAVVQPPRGPDIDAVVGPIIERESITAQADIVVVHRGSRRCIRGAAARQTADQFSGC